MHVLSEGTILLALLDLSDVVRYLGSLSSLLGARVFDTTGGSSFLFLD